jgi:demethylmenaquinone methyltransferase/2-methoxy-6-polyprenyl-1,4-benzoquinol methylase
MGAVGPDFEPAHVAELFDHNAATYDRINTIITFGLDALWRRWAARQATPVIARPMAVSVGQAPSPLVLDACAGTGLLTLDLARRGAEVTAVDAAPGMLAVARDRLAAAGLPARMVVADLSDAATPDTLGGPFDAVTLGFGLRYFADPGALLRPLRELLAPGGRLVIVEAVRPPRGPLGAAAGLYFFEVAPRLGAALAGRAALYEFLTASTRALGTADDVAAHLGRAGFTIETRRRFACGMVAGLVARPA